MRRYQVPDEILKYLEKNLVNVNTYKNVWAGFIEEIKKAMKDNHDNPVCYATDHCVLEKPKQFDYKSYLLLKENLEKEIKNMSIIKELLDKSVLKPINYPFHTNYNISIGFDKLRLGFAFQLKHSKKTLIENILSDNKINFHNLNDFEKYFNALNIYLKECKNHISWLESDVESFYDVFKESKKNSVKTRKLLIKS